MAETKKESWLKDCEICNAGLTAEMDEQIKEKGLGQREAAKELVKQQEQELGYVIYTENAIRQRYRYYKGKKDKKVGQIDPTKEKGPKDREKEWEKEIKKQAKKHSIKLPKSEPGETVTVEINKTYADALVELNKKGALKPGWKTMDRETLINFIIVDRVKSGYNKLHKMMELETKRDRDKQVANIIKRYNL
jgi:hypothetical protein